MKRQEWMKRKKYIPIVAVIACLTICGFAIVYSVGYNAGQKESSLGVGEEQNNSLTEAYNDGFAAGEKSGYEKGYAYGQKYGLEEGYEQGKSAASVATYSDISSVTAYRNSIYNEGYKAGFEYGAECMLKDLVDGASNITVYARFNGGEIVWEYYYDEP